MRPDCGGRVRHKYIVLSAGTGAGVAKDGRFESHDYAVRLCVDCGEFDVSTRKNGQYMNMSFCLWTAEAVKAAAKPYGRVVWEERDEMLKKRTRPKVALLQES